MKADDTATRIRRNAIDLFARNGFASTGIRELAENVGITTSSLYHHIDSKDDLLDRIVGSSMRALNDIATFWTNANGSPSERLAGLIGTHVVVHATSAPEVMVVDRQLGAMRRESRRDAESARDDYESSWRALIIEGVESGEFTASHPELAARALLGASTAVADWYRPGGAFSTMELATEYVAMSLNLLKAATTPEMPDLNKALEIFDQRWETP